MGQKKIYIAFSNSRNTSNVFLLTDVAFYIKKDVANPPPRQWSGFEWSDLLVHSFIHDSTNIYSKSTLHVNPS